MSTKELCECNGGPPCACPDCDHPDCAFQQPECLDLDETCSGTVEYRTPLSGTGRAFPRCEHHWSLRLESHERHRQWEVSARQVDWFDAGEVWDEE